MYAFRAIGEKGWCPILITALAIVGCIFEWPVMVLVPVIAIILVVGLVLFALGAREKELEQASHAIAEFLYKQQAEAAQQPGAQPEPGPRAEEEPQAAAGGPKAGDNGVIDADFEVKK